MVKVILDGTTMRASAERLAEDYGKTDPITPHLQTNEGGIDPEATGRALGEALAGFIDQARSMDATSKDTFVAQRIAGLIENVTTLRSSSKCPVGIKIVASAILDTPLNVKVMTLLNNFVAGVTNG